MDRRVKERLVGATILVVLIVLIVPELLSGPKPRSVAPSPAPAGAAEPVRNVTVDLATSKATPEDDAAASAPASTSSPDAAAGADPASSAIPPIAAPATAASSAGVPAAASNIATLRAQPVTPPLETPAPNPRSASRTASTASTAITASKAHPAPAKAAARSSPVDTSHHWAVQLGSFASRANADKLVRQIKASAGSAYVSSSGKGAQLRYRVRVGPLADRGAAERALVKFKKQGLSPSVVAP